MNGNEKCFGATIDLISELVAKVIFCMVDVYLMTEPMTNIEAKHSLRYWSPTFIQPFE